VTAAGYPVPAWLRHLAAAAKMMDVPPPLRPPTAGGRRSAVLVLFAVRPNRSDDPDLLFIQRSEGLRLHAYEEEGGALARATLAEDCAP